MLRGLVDFGIAFVIFLGFMVYYNFAEHGNLLLFPFAVLWGIVASLGVGLWFTAVGVKYRDIAQALPFIVQILFWVTPVGYSSTKIPAKWELVYWMNPMTGVIESFRYTLLGTANTPPNLIILSITISIIIFVAGVINFRRMERESLLMLFKR